MKKSVQVSGMHCHHCVNAVRQALSSLPDVTILDVDIGSATILTSSASDEDVRNAIDQDGYAVTGISTT
jgi:copper chaperone CopZ